MFLDMNFKPNWLQDTSSWNLLPLKRIETDFSAFSSQAKNDFSISAFWVKLTGLHWISGHEVVPENWFTSGRHTLTVSNILDITVTLLDHISIMFWDIKWVHTSSWPLISDRWLLSFWHSMILLDSVISFHLSIASPVKLYGSSCQVLN